MKEIYGEISLKMEWGRVVWHKICSNQTHIDIDQVIQVDFPFSKLDR